MKALKLPAAVRAALASRTPQGQLMVGLMTAPLSVQDQQIRVLLIVDPESGRVLKAEALLGPGLVETAALRLLDWLAGQRPSPEGAPASLPTELITDSLELYALLKDILPGFGMKFLGMEGFRSSTK